MDVVRLETVLEEGRHLAEKASALENWHFLVAENRNPISKWMFNLVIPYWDARYFNSNKFSQIIFSIISHCNTLDLHSLAIPIIGHSTKEIPVRTFALSLLGAISEFTSQTPRLSLKVLEIVITDSILIQPFTKHFLTPLQQHFSPPFSPNITTKIVDDPEITCPVCLDVLLSVGVRIRELA